MWICPRIDRHARAALLLLLCAPGAWSFGWDDARALARARAQTPFTAPAPLEGWLSELDPREWGRIRFDPRLALFTGPKARFTVALHHPGGLYREPVRVHVLDAQGAPQRVPFDPAAFFYAAETTRGAAPAELGHAGVTVRWHPSAGEAREIGQWLGGSFLRAGAPQAGGGTRARAATLEVGLPQGEEFPRFTDLYLAPGAGPNEFVVYALLDSPRLTGAYRYTLTPEAERTRVAVRAALYARAPIEKLGVGALESLFYSGEERARAPGEWRPEVHSADVLLTRSAAGVYVARTLNNPTQLAMEDFAPPAPQAFGLVQRDRRFDHYQDLDQRLEARPNAWLVPDADFPDGTLELLELPLGDPFNLNVLAHWVVDAPPQPGRPLEFGYTLDWGTAEPLPAALGRVVAVRSAAITQPQPLLIAQVDFGNAGGDMPKAPVRAQGVALEGGRILAHSLVRDAALGIWRLTLRVAREGRGPVILEARLVREGAVLTETWHGVFGPERLP